MHAFPDNSSDRTISVFFYGLYMDPDVLRGKDIEPRDGQQATAEGYSLRIGHKATLLRAPGTAACGMVYSLTHAELDRLYWGAGLDEYRAEPLLVRTSDGKVISVLCCNLLQPPAEHEENPGYAQSLREAMMRAGLQGPFPEPSKLESRQLPHA
ncbi:gamma-glutamylcyclotransferase [Streptomyces sp. NBC_01077]|uniref:gamma-glutamylcyclotransferase family protein n=1 Tax=Streptomyces sp. NBC_01077 TaxID=2903746 RepID=UPI00386E7D36|nr:gamma-glutamylcyclotransferase [Streptomyces sp. NBC_01077]WSV43494.1 gamma-glutamylcyclotransferase [Streptomyces sp. NBC_01077]